MITPASKRNNLNQQIQQKQSGLFERLQNNPFWICNVEEHKKAYYKILFCLIKYVVHIYDNSLS